MKKLEYLIEKYLEGEISPEELEKLNILLLKEENKLRFKELSGLYYKLNLQHIARNTEAKKKSYSGILNQIKPVKRLKSTNYLSIAAGLVLVIGISLFFIFQKEGASNTESNYAILETSEGHIKELKTEEFQIKNSANEILVQKTGDTLTYSERSNEEKITQNTLRVPHGKRMVLKLADGSMVHLNAGSTLIYPTGFTKDGIREVRLEGEGYFEISHDESRPFVVHAQQLAVEVLGTSFNFNSYTNNSYATATLIEGKVAIKKENGPALYLQPGMMANFSRANGTIETLEVDTDVYTAWTNGRLVFERNTLEDIANTLERKFNLKINFKNKALKTERFTAKFDHENIEQILESLRQSYHFEYIINEHEVILR